MFELAWLELRWLTRPSRSALIRGIRAAMRREGVFEAAGPDRERWSEGLTSHADRTLDARLAQEARTGIGRHRQLPAPLRASRLGGDRDRSTQPGAR